MMDDYWNRREYFIERFIYDLEIDLQNYFAAVKKDQNSKNSLEYYWVFMPRSRDIQMWNIDQNKIHDMVLKMGRKYKFNDDSIAEDIIEMLLPNRSNCFNIDIEMGQQSPFK